MTTLFGPLGNLLEIDCPAPQIDVSRRRSSSANRTIDGSMYVQLGALTLRTAVWEFPRELEDLQPLLDMYYGLYGNGPFYWYDPIAASTNMLQPGVAIPGVAGPWGVGWEAVAGTISAEGSGVLRIDAASSAQSLYTVPVLPSTEYTARAERVAGGAANASIQVEWLDSLGSVVGATSTSSGTGLVSVTATSHASAASARIVLAPVEADYVDISKVRLSEGQETSWLSGRGMGAWAIVAMTEVYNFTEEDGWPSEMTHTATLQEVLA